MTYINGAASIGNGDRRMNPVPGSEVPGGGTIGSSHDTCSAAKIGPVYRDSQSRAFDHCCAVIRDRISQISSGCGDSSHNGTIGARYGIGQNKQGERTQKGAEYANAVKDGTYEERTDGACYVHRGS